MKKIFHLLAATAITVSASYAAVGMMAPTAVETKVAAADVVLTPAAGEVQTLKSFTLTFPGATEVTQGTVSYDTAPYVIRTDVEGASKQYCFSFSFSGNTISLAVSNEITEPGTYELHLLGGFYQIDGETPEEELVWTYDVTGAPVLPEVILSPEPGEVETLKDFTLTFPDATEITQGTVSYDTAPYVIRTDVEGASKQYCFTFSFSDNTISLAVSSEITEPGSYELHLLSGFYKIDGETPKADMMWTYEVTGPAMTPKPTVYPASGAVTTLSEIAVDFENATEVAANTLTWDNATWLMDENGNKTYCSSMTASGTRLVINFANAPTTPGTYTLQIPAGAASVDGASFDEVLTAEYVYIDPASISINPAEGVVESLYAFQVTFEEAESLTLNPSHLNFAYNPKVYGVDSDYMLPSFTHSVEGNVLSFNLISEIYASGEYRLEIPVELVEIDGCPLQTPLVYYYTVVDPTIGTEFAMELNPAPGQVETLTEIQITFPDAQTLTLNDYTTQTSPYIQDEENRLAKNYCIVTIDGNVMTLEPTEPVTAEGEYYLVMPQFYLVDEELPTVRMFTYDVTGIATKEVSASTIPAAGTVTELSEITVRFQGVKNVAYDAFASKQPTIMDEEGNEAAIASIFASGSRLTITLAEKVTDNGTYTLTVPTDCYTVDGYMPANELQFEFVIGSQVGVDAMVMDGNAESIWDMYGRKVASDVPMTRLSSLPAGVYIVKTAAGTFKINNK